MGNNDSKSKSTSRHIPVEEIRHLATRLSVKHESDTVPHDRFFSALGWNDLNTPITHQLWGFISGGTSGAKFGSVLDVVDTMLFRDQSSAAELVSQVMPMPLGESALKYTQSIIQLFDSIQTPARTSWQSAGVPMSENAVSLLSQHMCRSFLTLEDYNASEAVQKWLSQDILLHNIQSAVFSHMFKLMTSFGSEIYPNLTSNFGSKPPPLILDKCDILFINKHLPHDMQTEWSLLFSSEMHGFSFTSMLGKITNKGPTIIIVKDTKGHVFGGFAPESWRLGPKFYGDGRSFLFTLRPHISVFNATGYNNHYMYFNIQQQTMPNGLGMGGQLEHFGIWIDADFGKGHSSEGCSTYQHVPKLSSEKEFSLEVIEVWAVGPPPKEESDDESEGNKRSILDRDNAAKALLEMVNRGQHSEGLREPEDC